MTQREKFMVHTFRMECLYDYLKFCELIGEPPKSEIIEPVMGCVEFDKFKAFKEIMKKRTEEYNGKG